MTVGGYTPLMRRQLPLLIALVAIATLGLLVTASLRAAAQATPPAPGVLRLTPAVPREGQVVQVSYTPSPAMAGAKGLVLRAAAFGAAGAAREMPARTLATLAPAAGGRFAGQFTVPAGVTLLRLAVESPSGDRVDRNGDAYVDLVMAGADGRPNYDGLWWSALWARVRLAGGVAASTREGAALRARVDSVATLYPDRAGGWRLRALAAGMPSDAERAERITRASALDQRLARQAAPNLADATELANFADDLGLEPMAERWRNRIIADSLRTDAVSRNVWYLEASRRGVQAMARGEPAPLLARAVAQWQPGVATTLNLRLTESGARLAMMAGDTARARQWFDRCGDACTLSFPPTATEAVLPFMLGRIAQLRARPIGSGERPLGVSVAEAAAVDTNVRARLVAGQAELLAKAGRAKEAEQARAEVKRLAPNGLGRGVPAAGLAFSARAHLAMVSK